MRGRSAWRRGIAWLKDRADNVAVALLAAMFVSFILQILFRYVVGAPLTWTLEACLLTWLWLVFWCAGFLLDDRDHVKFDILYAAAAPPLRRVFAIVSALVIVVAFAAALPATFDFIAFMRIESSSSLGVRLDYVFACYLIFSAGVLVRYGLRALGRLSSGEAAEAPADPDRSR
ncbi:MAG: TRAP transporter small permease subunit [Kiloniellales bacterium]|nr:TRAP transporter small permease subunit [Kiloniellales bacterium]